MSNRPRHRGRVTDPSPRQRTLAVFGDVDRPYVVLDTESGEAWSWCSSCGVVMDFDIEVGPTEQVCPGCALRKLVG